MFNAEHLQEKWDPILSYDGAPKIEDAHRKMVTAVLLENQEKFLREQSQFMYEQPTNDAGGGFGGSAPNASNGATPTAGFDPVLISLIRRSMPNLVAYDLAGVQPMSGPTGLIFAMRSRTSTQGGDEALFNEVNTVFSGSAAGNNASQDVIDGGSTPLQQAGADPTARASGSGYTVGTGMTTAQAEALGDGASNAFQEMAFSIEKISVTAVSRALKAEYTMELAQDLKAIHGLDAETELSNILSAEILAEINREVVRTINYTATAGSQNNVTTAGTFDLDTDSNGRWSVEKFKGLMFNIERDANEIAKATRRGKGNMMICSSDVASALQMAGVLDYTPALNNNLQVDDTGNTFAGVLNGRIKVYIDPYFSPANSGASAENYYTLGYKGSSAFDAGLFYCPYVPLQMVRAIGENTFQPKIGFKTRYGMVANPFATSNADGAIAFAKKNIYYRLSKVANLM